MISRDTQKVFYVIHQIKMKKNRNRRKPFKDDKYQLPKADSKHVDSENRWYYHEGKSKMSAMLQLFSQGEDLGENSDSWAPHRPTQFLWKCELGICVLHTTQINILHADSPDPHITLI